MFALSNKNAEKHFSELAQLHGLRFLSLNSVQTTSTLLEKNKCTDYLKLQALPIAESKTTITIATANPTDQNIKLVNKFWKKETKKKIEIVVTSRDSIVNMLAHQFEKDYTHYISHCRDDLDHKHSASYTFSLKEKLFLIVLLIMMALAALSNFFLTTLFISAYLATGTIIILAYKMGLSIHTLRFLGKSVEKFSLPINTMPIYTILIPLLREKEETIKILLESLQQIDYPKKLLDIKLLLERDDEQTLKVIDTFNLPWYFQSLIVPPGLPRSKPHACNYGLQLAFGEYLTIYDAEDRPDRDQLKMVLQRFHDNSEYVACVQAPLNFYNYRENLLTRLFTIEYTYWFDFLVPALSSLNAPVPLGGTSNHFKMDVLRKIGGWDPYIGTEDAEIGVRMYRLGYKVVTTHSTTYEEANTRLVNWFKQRTRWNKGYMQTYLVNMRDPINMLKQIGPGRFINFQLFVGGNVFIQLANLPLYIFLITSLILPDTYFLTSYHKFLLYLTWYNFIISNLTLLICQFIATYKRRLYCLLPYVPLKLFYWMLMSLSGYYAVIELLLRPGYWYKTEHGISKETDLSYKISSNKNRQE